ncbi:putative AAA family ATPase y4kL [Geobacter sp. OR-1]|uniref:AAA family ATPase n=1 Tax=Geobacter sp. OR-1 TaxID=1266765 RepID=UPI0005434431|nr:AAA family ATPase [Geobacter sp. OR-1]GAM10190.1 putative AAA family ATPase y4kL [Geobacter sp. OR-1]
MAFTSTLKNIAGKVPEDSAYNNACEHLRDELQRVDLLIRRHLARHDTGGEPGLPERFRGLVITGDEIASILARPPAYCDPCASGRADGLELDTELRSHEALIASRVAASARQGIDLPLCRLAAAFGLSSLETCALTICIAPEIDARYERLYAYLHDDVTRKLPTPGLIIDLLAVSAEERGTARLTFGLDSPLFHQRLLSCAATSEETPLLSRPLRIDERISCFLLGSEAIDSRIAPFAAMHTDLDRDLITLAEADQQRLLKFGRRYSERHQGEGVLFCFHGPAGTGRKAMAGEICQHLGVPLLMVAIGELDHDASAFREGVDRIVREALLQNAGLCLHSGDELLNDRDDRHRLQYLARQLVRFPRPVFIVAAASVRPGSLFRGAHLLSVAFPVPDLRQRKEFWEREGGLGLRVAAGVDFGALAGRFGFTPGQIRDAVAAAEDLSRWQHPESPQITEDDLYAASRDHSNPKLSELARKIVPRSGWDDLVLPPDRIAQLAELCRHSRYRHIVYGEWGFDQKLSYGKGLSALFTGPPGTGKTMAAEVIAIDLRLELYKIDLSQVVSKYIGETEKNLDRIFSEAATGNAILFFDEADALFGKRSEVKDAHDRYANIETGYLLQKMEEYEGIAILATNLRGNMDEAFVRRIHFIVEFPFPQERERQAIWEKIWPEATPLDARLDMGLLARRFEIAGG